MLIIGIAGGSGSGKTTVVQKTLKYFPLNQIAVVHMDSYYKDNIHLTLEERSLINFDHPDAIEFDLLYQHLQELKSGKSIEEPKYDFITSTRKKETVHIDPKHVIIVEGILLFTDKRLRDLCNIKVYVDAEADDRVIRIIQRDMEQRGRTVSDVLERYEVVKNMHFQFIEPTKRFADIIIPQGGQNQVAIEMLVATIQMKLQQENNL
ncbi:MAG: uridine kinase [Bacteroidetes bacterium]|nr:uridine kinase [Bacteroidota bacterium]